MRENPRANMRVPYANAFLRLVPPVILSGSEESDTLILFFQIFHFVQDDMTWLLSQILHSACGSVQDDKGRLQDAKTP